MFILNFLKVVFLDVLRSTDLCVFQVFREECTSFGGAWQRGISLSLTQGSCLLHIHKSPSSCHEYWCWWAKGSRDVLWKGTWFFQKGQRSVVLSPESSTYMRPHALVTVGRHTLCYIKFTKKGNFRLHITALDYLAQYAMYKVWVKSNAEMSFLYGAHVPKAGLARITEDTPQMAGVVVFSQSNMPLGFGLGTWGIELLTAGVFVSVVLERLRRMTCHSISFLLSTSHVFSKSRNYIATQATEVCQSLEPTAIVVLNQSDIGMYLRYDMTDCAVVTPDSITTVFPLTATEHSLHRNEDELA